MTEILRSHSFTAGLEIFGANKLIGENLCYVTTKRISGWCLLHIKFLSNWIKIEDKGFGLILNKRLPDEFRPCHEFNSYPGLATLNVDEAIPITFNIDNTGFINIRLQIIQREESIINLRLCDFSCSYPI